MEIDKIYCGDNLEVMRSWPDACVDMCVTSPPYYGLRDYGVDGQIGLEATPEEYVAKLVAVFSEVKRVLKDDGVLWVNMGDSYWGGKGASGYELPDEAESRRVRGDTMQTSHNVPGYMNMRPTDGKHSVIKPKDLIGIPWMVAFALRADGWYLRSDIIWAKPNPMPESVTDRPTKSHEYIFLLSKSAHYYYDAEAIAEPSTDPESIAGRRPRNPRKQDLTGDPKLVQNVWKLDGTIYETRNKRDVWTVTTKPYKEAHFATFPPDLIEPCILAGSKVGGLVLDPFMGSGTTASVAITNGRHYVGIELNPEYCQLAEKRIHETPIPLFIPETSNVQRQA